MGPVLTPLLLASALDGTWVQATPLEQVRATQKASTDAALADLPSFLRPYADHVLAPTYKVCGRYELSMGDILSVVCDDAPPIRLAPDGQQHVITVGDHQRPVSVRRDGEIVVLTIYGDDGMRETRYQPTSDGMRVTITLHNPHLDQTIGWSVDYTHP